MEQKENDFTTHIRAFDLEGQLLTISRDLDTGLNLNKEMDLEIEKSKSKINKDNK